MTVRRLDRGPLRGMALCLAVAALLAACGPFAPPEEPVVVTFAIPATTTHFTQANFESLAQAFNGANPDVEVRLRSVSIDEVRGVGDLYADLLLDEEWGIDAFFAGRGVTARLVESGRILNLQPLLELDLGWDLDDFSAALGQFQQDAGLWAVPTEFAPLVLFYNKDLFDQAGVAYPPSPAGGWTWDDFLAMAAALRRALPPQDFAFAGACAASVPFVYAHGGSLLDEVGNCDLQHPRTVEALQWYFDLALVHGVMPTLAQVQAYQPDLPPQVAIKVGIFGAEEIGEGQRRAMEADGWLNVAAGWGDAAMWIAPLWERGGWQQTPWEFRWGVAPLPRDAVEVAVLDSFGCFITTHSPHPREALRWIDFLTRHRVQIAGLPARRSLARSEAFRNALPLEIDGQCLDALLAQVERGWALSLSQLTSGAPRCLGDALLAIYEGGEDVKTALRMTNDQ